MKSGPSFPQMNWLYNWFKPIIKDSLLETHKADHKLTIIVFDDLTIYGQIVFRN